MVYRAQAGSWFYRANSSASTPIARFGLWIPRLGAHTTPLADLGRQCSKTTADGWINPWMVSIWPNIALGAVCGPRGGWHGGYDAHGGRRRFLVPSEGKSGTGYFTLTTGKAYLSGFSGDGLCDLVRMNGDVCVSRISRVWSIRGSTTRSVIDANGFGLETKVGYTACTRFYLVAQLAALSRLLSTQETGVRYRP